jgi:hypothetical protein
MGHPRKDNRNRRTWRDAAKVVLDGQPYAGHVLDFECLNELKNFQEIIFSVARARWVSEHGTKKVPNGFVSSLRLGLKGISEGSAIAHLSVADGTGTQPLLFAPIFDDVIDVIWRSLKLLDLEDRISDDFPRQSIPYLREWGSRLPKGSLIGLNKDNEKIFMTDRKRDCLARIEGQKSWISESIMLGEIAAISNSSRTLSFKDSKSNRIIDGEISDDIMDQAIDILKCQRKGGVCTKLYADVAYDYLNFSPEKIVKVKHIDKKPISFLMYDPESPSLSDIINLFHVEKNQKKDLKTNDFISINDFLILT